MEGMTEASGGKNYWTSRGVHGLIAPYIHRTPVVKSAFWSAAVGADVYLKLENMQVTGSFKPRGAGVRMLQLTPEERALGVVTMSAGNHAQGVAFFAKKLGISAKIIMPSQTPQAKIQATEALGASIELFGQTLSDAETRAQEIVQKENRTLIHPYDDPQIIAGQGTLALEILADVPDAEVIIVPVGGGGLAAGVCLATHEQHPHVDIYGVQSTFCPEMIRELYPQRWFVAPEPILMPVAEGITVKKPGQLTKEILSAHLIDILAVTDDQIEQAICDLMTQDKVVSEGAGAAGVAALSAFAPLFKGKKIVVVVCGGNIDARILSALLLRDLIIHKKLISFSVTVRDAPGMLAQCAKIIGDAGGNIFELRHQRLLTSLTVKMTSIDLVVETKGLAHAQIIAEKLQVNGFPTKICE